MLLSHAVIVFLTSLACSDAVAVRQSTKPVADSLAWEKKRTKKKISFWHSFQPAKPPEAPNPNAYLPVLSKADLSTAYYQFAVDEPGGNTIAFFGEGDWKYFQSGALTFGNTHSACGFLQITEFLSRVLAFCGIAAIGDVGDFVTIFPPTLAATQRRFTVDLFQMLGLIISPGAGGNIRGEEGKRIETLGLDYTSYA